MGLSSQDAKGGGQAPQTIYIQQGTVTQIEAYYNENPDRFGYPFDINKTKGRSKIGLDIGIAVDGLHFDPSVWVDGLLKHDREGRVVGWGSAFKVVEAIRELAGDMKLQEGLPGGEFEATDDNRIPKEVLKKLIGQPITSLQYVTERKDDGKLKYATFGRITSPARDKMEDDDHVERLEFRFHNADGGDHLWPKFNPRLIEDRQNTSSNGSPKGGGLSSQQSSAPAASEETFEPDDDLPF